MNQTPPSSPAGAPVTPIQPLPRPREWRTPAHFTSTVCGIVEAGEDYLDPTQLLTFLEAIHGVVSDALAKARRQFGAAGAVREMAGLTTSDLEGSFRNVTDRLQMRPGHGENTIRRTPEQPENKTVVTWLGNAPAVQTVPVYDDAGSVGSAAAVPANN